MTIYYAVVQGDPLDNGGNSQVIGGAQHATIEGPDGRSRGQTHLGHEAWCSACQSFGPILAGAGIRESLRGWDESLNAFEAVSGDIVLCKCERHPRVVSVYARTCEYIDSGGHSAVSSSFKPEPATCVIYDEQFTFRDNNGHVLAEVYYTVHLPSGELLYGVTDSQGRTSRYETNGARSIQIFLGHNQEA